MRINVKHQNKIEVFVNKKCVNCGNDADVKKYSLCSKCRLAINTDIEKRSKSENPTEEMIDQINNDFQNNNTVYSNDWRKHQ